MKQIAAAIIAVMKEVKGMEKNSRVGSGHNSYDGTKDQDVKEVMNKAMANNGLCILPTNVESSIKVSRWEEVDQWSKSTPKAMKQKQSVFTEVITKYLLLHESGESIELSGYGHGVDAQDKGAGKATTYALKNCLLYMFLTPVGKIDDTDTTHSEAIATPPKKKAAPKKAVDKRTVLTDDKVNTVTDWAIEKKWTIVTVEKNYKITPVQKGLIVSALNKAKKKV
tara:strand:+ start:193 stop:864 length:672 start_codon:yes stop_codon:yes gene_type:complete